MKENLKREFSGRCKKYEILKNQPHPAAGDAFRIRALRSFGGVKKGDLGGYISSERNLSHEGNCWVSDSAIVTSFARVSENGQVCDDALISGRVEISGNAKVCGESTLYSDKKISGNTVIFQKNRNNLPRLESLDDDPPPIL